MKQTNGSKGTRATGSPSIAVSCGSYQAAMISFARDERYRPTLDTKPFIDHFDDDAADFLVQDVGSRSLKKKQEVLAPGTTWAGELQALVSKIDNPVKADLVLSVFTSMINGDVEGARARIDLERGIATNIEDFNPECIHQRR